MTLTAVATLTSKGQLTVPKAIRDALGLHEGDQVRFEAVPGQGKTTLEPLRYQVDDLWSLAVPGTPRMDFKEMEEAKRAGAHR